MWFKISYIRVSDIHFLNGIYTYVIYIHLKEGVPFPIIRLKVMHVRRRVYRSIFTEEQLVEWWRWLTCTAGDFLPAPEVAGSKPFLVSSLITIILLFKDLD